MALDPFQHELLKAAFALAVGLLVARVGLAYYFRQKEYETVKQRYLEQSVDLVASELESVSRAFSHNWARSLELLRLYRELPGLEFDPEELKKGFVELHSTNFQQIAHHRLTTLLRSNIIWEIYQLSLAGHKHLNQKVTVEFVQGIRLHHAGRLNLAHKQFIAESEALLKPLNDESDRYAYLLLTLQVIAAELEQSKFRFKEIKKFHKRKNVVTALENLKGRFADELGKAIA